MHLRCIFYIGKFTVPCKKCDMDSHGNSMSQLDLVAVSSKLTPNSMTIPCHLSRFYLFSMPKHDMDFTFYTSSSHGISMAFPQKMTGFPSDLVSYSNQTKLPSCQYGMRKSVSHFLQGNSHALTNFHRSSRKGINMNN